MKKNLLFLTSLLVVLTFSYKGETENSTSIKAIVVTPEALTVIHTLRVVIGSTTYDVDTMEKVYLIVIDG